MSEGNPSPADDMTVRELPVPDTLSHFWVRAVSPSRIALGPVPVVVRQSENQATDPGGGVTPPPVVASKLTGPRSPTTAVAWYVVPVADPDVQLVAVAKPELLVLIVPGVMLPPFEAAK